MFLSFTLLNGAPKQRKEEFKTTLLEKRKKDVIVSATTTYCQLGTTCIKTLSVGYIFKVQNVCMCV